MVETQRPEINYALVESTRPPMYQAMKYWGKKPHNIWSTYIERYCPPGGIVLDPFVGSGIAAFEAAKLGRNCVAFDLNPLSGFFIEVLSSKFEEDSFRKAFQAIYKSVEANPVYKKHYTTEYKGKKATVFNYRWLANELSEVVLQTEAGDGHRIGARQIDKMVASEMKDIRNPHWYPKDKFPDTPSINHKFVKDLGGNTFDHLWTKRNLFVLSLIFSKILELDDRALQLQLLSGFVQALHLTCRMVYPRSKESNRDFSGSWGRADYMIRRKSMEQNPLIVFSRSCSEKQGVIAAMRDVAVQFPNRITKSDITLSRKVKKRSQISFGTVDVADLERYIEAKSVDFIITDPPYAGLVRYLDLSLVWLVWLKRLDKKYEPDLRSEITIKEGSIGREEYRRRLTNAFKQMHRVLKDEGKIVITFHHQEIREWNEFVNAVRLSGFRFDKVTHQYNRRSGESNVANPYGTSGSDFYIRCVKRRDVDFTDDSSGLKDFILQKSIEIIARRNEPTPYTFLFEGLVPELLQAGLSQPPESSESVKSVLIENAGKGKIFLRESNAEAKSGDIWWFNEPAKYISHPDRPLKDRVEDTIVALLRRKVSVRLDDVLAELFREYPNGLTPDVRAVRSILEKYAYRSAGNWKVSDTTARLATVHTEIIQSIALLGKRIGLQSFVGRRERSEPCSNGSNLSEYSACDRLLALEGYDSEQVERIEMIDLLWLDSELRKPLAAFEVENSTNFTSALQRASNLEVNIPKFMVIPDERERELRATRDPLFRAVFADHSWRYLTYSQLKKFSSYSLPSIVEMYNVAAQLPS